MASPLLHGGLVFAALVLLQISITTSPFGTIAWEKIEETDDYKLSADFISFYNKFTGSFSEGEPEPESEEYGEIKYVAMKLSCNLDIINNDATNLCKSTRILVPITYIFAFLNLLLYIVDPKSDFESKWTKLRVCILAILACSAFVHMLMFGIFNLEDTTPFWVPFLLVSVAVIVIIADIILIVKRDSFGYKAVDIMV